MTFPTQETSAELGQPVSLFHFVYGQRPQDYFAYTDFDVPITHNTIDYEPTVIEREEIQITGQVEDQRFEIQINPNLRVDDLSANTYADPKHLSDHSARALRRSG